MAEDRKLFREAMDRIGLETPRHHRPAPKRANGKATCRGIAIGDGGLEDRPACHHPPAFTLGGTGGGVAYNRDDYEASRAG